MQILIIGSLAGQIGAASQIAIKRGAKVLHADDVDSGLVILRSGKGADLVLIDVKEPIKDLINSLSDERINTPVIACGVANDTQAAVEAIRIGAKEYIPFPPDAELIAAVLEAVAEEDNAFICKDPKMEEVLNMALQVAPSDASILVTGPSGTGKEVVARFIHKKSKRKNNRFVAVNCAAIPENLLESELFGHEKGAFTGAVARRIGKFEEANAGTLLLDEITEMDPRLQAKLLRVIQEREIDRVGGKQPVNVDVRIIATSNRNIDDSVKKGDFREDLYFRLNVISLNLPALTNRPADIMPLANFFASKYAEANGVSKKSFSTPAETNLKSYSWPGNVRELENTVHRAVLLSNGEIIEESSIVLETSSLGNNEKEAALPNHQINAGLSGNSAFVGRSVADVERDLIIETLHHCLGNRTHAANILGISIRTLRNKLKQYNGEGFDVPLPGETTPVSS